MHCRSTQVHTLLLWSLWESILFRVQFSHSLCLQMTVFANLLVEGRLTILWVVDLKLEYEVDPLSPEVGTLRLSGYVRVRALSVNQLVIWTPLLSHIVCVQTLQIHNNTMCTWAFSEKGVIQAPHIHLFVTCFSFTIFMFVSTSEKHFF